MDKALPLGRSNFAALRTRDEIYVDKTALIHRLCRSDAKIFLTRPRRFGKSLLVSTFEALFKDGLPKVEIRNAGGRSDLEVEVDGKRWIFEFKFARKTAEVSPLLDEAIEKIRACRYGGPRENDGSIRVAAVFDAASRQFTAWRTVALA